MRKKSLALFVCFVMIAVIFTGCAPKAPAASGEQAAASEVIKIGAVFPMTGDVATFGESSKNAVSIAVDEVNAKGGILGKKVEVIYEDDSNTPANSANAIQKLISNDKVVAVLGSVSSKCSIAMGPIATQNKIPMISSTSTNPKVTTEGGEYVFRACFIDPFQGTVIAKFATETLKFKNAAVLYDVSNDYSKGLGDYFKAGFEKLGGKVLAMESYNGGDQDFNAQLTKIKPMNPEVILLADYYNTVGLIAKQARALGITATFVGGDGWDSADLYKVGGDAIDGGYFSNHYSADDTSPLVVEFRKSYEAKTGKTPDALAALAYDAAKILFAAIEKAGSTDGAKIKDAMQATNLEVVSGKVTFDKDRNPIKGAVMIKVVKDKYEFAAKVNP
ncbi:MAG: ABC transporter substrate-binding protein [Clostridia bacterium]